MKAIIWAKYGPPDVLQLREVEKPSPKDNEVLIRIHATTVTTGDCEVRSLNLPLYLSLPMRIWLGFRRPSRITIPGNTLAGEIEAAGKAVTLFKEGDQVFGSTGLGFGACAEYVCMAEVSKQIEGVLTTKPANMTYVEAAAIPFGGLEALHFLREGDIKQGEKVLINGAGGSIGTFGVQLARYYGAEVTAVDSAGKLDMLRSIGAEQVIDYMRDDFTKSGETYDVIFDTVGKNPFSRCESSLKENGRYISANPNLSEMVLGGRKSKRNGKQAIYQGASYKREDLIFLRELVEAGRISPVIDRHYRLEQIAEAHRYVDTGQKKGNVVITVA